MKQLMTDGELSVFSGQLAMILHSGISTLEGIEILKEDAVLATGGGTPLREDNRMAMKNAGVPVILLEASSKKTFERLQGDDTRPLAAGLDETSLENLKNQRRQAYEECADYAIKTDEMTPLEITEKISKLL